MNKQEILEVVAKKFSTKFLNNGENSEFEAQSAYLGFIKGTKWQQEYESELLKQRDELIELLKKVLIVSPIPAFKMSELQDEIEELLTKIQSNE